MPGQPLPILYGILRLLLPALTVAGGQLPSVIDPHDDGHFLCKPRNLVPEAELPSTLSPSPVVGSTETKNRVWSRARRVHDSTRREQRADVVVR